MRWEAELIFEDRDGQRRTCSCYVVSSGTIADVIAFAAAAGDRAQGISDAQLVAGRLSSKVAPSLATVAGPASDVRRKALVILKGSDDTYGSLLVPSPGDLPWEQDGPYPGRRITKDTYPPDGPIAQLIGGLAVTVRPDGSPMLIDDWAIFLLHD